jgi:hypothetical protein
LFRFPLRDIQVDEHDMVALALESPREPLFARPPPPAMTAGQHDNRLFHEHSAEHVPGLTTDTYPDGRIHTAGKRHRAMRFTQLRQITPASVQFGAVRHHMRDEHND